MTLIQLWPVSVTRGGQHSSIDNTAYLLVECRIKTRCAGVGKVRFRMAGVGCDPTYYIETRVDTLSASTYSILCLQKERALPRR